MKTRLRLDEGSPAGQIGLALLALRERIETAAPDDLLALRERERELSNQIMTALVESGGLLDAVVRAERVVHTSPTGGTR